VSSPTSQGAFSCLRSNGFDFAIVRGYESVGASDPNSPASVANAWAAGLAHVDVYFFPALHHIGAAASVQQFHTFAQSHRMRFGMIWFDIEGSEYWSSNCATNVDYLATLIATANSLGYHSGIYASSAQWPIMCNTDRFAGLPLWWAHYEGGPTFGDFTPFGGWRKPAIKQFAGSTSLCGAGIDKNWYP